MKSINTASKLVALIVIFGLGWFAWQTFKQDEQVKAQNAQVEEQKRQEQEQEHQKREQKRQEQEQLTYTRDHITSFVTAERSSYQYNGLGGIYGLSIMVQNKTDYILDKVVVKVSYLKPSGQVWKDKYVDFYYVEPRKTIENKVADEQRGVRIEYKIVSITSRTLGLL